MAIADFNPEPVEVDVAVIGAGVNGCGVARDATLRGYRVALFERNDIAYGASGNSSGMIHGGPRYLSHNPDVTRSSCLDSGHIQRIAPHLLFRIPFLVPLYGEPGLTSSLALFAYDAFFDLYDDYQPLKRGKPHARLSPEELRQLEPGLVETSGGVTFDEWGIDGVRLCVAQVTDAVERGALFFNHTTVTEIERDSGGKVVGLRYRNRISGQAGRVKARIVVNATGAWAPSTVRSARLGPESAPIRPGKGIHVFLDRRLSNYAVVANAIDGRQVFLLPWQNMSVLGTTDDDFYGNPDEVLATPDEVRYLFQAIERVFPSIAEARAIGTWGGVRPTLYGWGGSEDALSREHRVVDHSADGASGLYSMIGGKLASYRLFSEEMVDEIGRALGKRVASSTHRVALPGGSGPTDADAWSQRVGLDAVAVARIAYRHGDRSPRILERIEQDPREGYLVCPCEPVTRAEVAYVVENEWAADVDDVSRRTRLGLGVCGGMRCALTCGKIIAEVRGASPEEGMAMGAEFLRLAARRRLSTLGPLQARQEAFSLGATKSALGRHG